MDYARQIPDMVFFNLITDREKAYMQNLVLHEGRPENTEGREEKEIRVYDLLDSLGIHYWRTDHEHADTMEACQDIDAVLDRLPTAKVLSEEDEVYIVEAEVFGQGIDMWLRSQGSFVERIKQD